MQKTLLTVFLFVASINIFAQDTITEHPVERSLPNREAFNDSISKAKTYDFIDSVKGIKITDMSEVVISGFHINDSLQNAPASISILTPAQIQRNNNADISPILNTLPGVFMQSGGINTNRISIRGIGARTPYGTNKIRAFYGSIPLTTGDSETTIEDIDLQMIDKIEVIKGPLSSLYGAGLGGAILLSPQHAYPGNTAKVSSTFGSFGLLKNTVNYGIGGKTASLNLSYHKLETDGYRANNHYNREGITLAGDAFRTAKSKLTYFGNYTYLKAYIPSSVTKDSYDNNPKAAAPTWAASKGYEQYNSYMGGLAYDWQLAGWLKNATSVFINSKKNYEPQPFGILTQNTTGYGARTQFSGDIKLGKQKSQFIAGMEYFKDGVTVGNFQNLYQSNNGNGTLQGDRSNASKQDRNFINAFAQLRIPLIDKLEVQAGVNYNATHFSLNTTYPVTTAYKQDYSYNGIWSPQASLLYKPSSLQTVYASVSRGFSMPAIEETQNADGTINPGIKPESGYNFEVGTKMFLVESKLYFEVSAYRMIVKNLLVAQRIGDNQYVGVNAGKTLHEGIEATLKYNINMGSKWFLQPYAAASVGHYTFREFLNNDINYAGKDLTGVPNNKINGGLTLQAPYGLSLGADYYYTDPIPLNDANSLYSDSYALLNAKAGWRYWLRDGFSLQLAAGVNNLTNTKYASMVLVNATGVNGAPPRYYYPGMPVNYYGNVSLTYNF